MLLNEGGNAKAKNGAEAAKVAIAEFSAEQYSDFKNSIIKIVKDIDDAFKKFSGEPLFPSKEAIDSFKVFSGSGNEFFKRSREEYSKVKPKIGDIDVQIDETKKEAVKKFLEENEGKKFGGFTYLGSQFGGDFYNIFKAPKKFQPQASNIQIDFEFISFDENGDPNEFDVFTKNSDWEDLSRGIKGLAKQCIIPIIYKVIYGRPGVVFTNTKDVPSKSFKDEEVPTKTYGFKGSRQKYHPVLDADGNQVEYEGKPAYREKKVSETPLNRDLSSIFEEMFGKKPTDSEKKMMYSYVGMLQLIKKYLKKNQIQKVYELYHKNILEQVDDESVAETIFAKFKEVFPFVYDIDEAMSFSKYVKQMYLRG